MPATQRLTKPRSGGGLLLPRRKPPLTRRSVAYFCSGEHTHLHRVLGGETLTFEDGLYPIKRKGHIEEAYVTLCFSSLRTEAGAIGGILVTVFEITERSMLR